MKSSIGGSLRLGVIPGMDDVLTVPLLENASRSDDMVAASVASTGRWNRPPVFVPLSQLYYWTREWQEGEAAALREIAEGKTRRFPDGTSAANWILSDDED